MHQIKLFKGIETELSQLQDEVNAWLRDNQNLRVLNIFGNIAPQTLRQQPGGSMGDRQFAPSDVLMTVVYEKS
ncbi:MAG: hypothetical protein HRU76_11425 [Phycisphaeraceae bacterium]|nr:hypothetical protein [Phycisphaerales bacterium]QOJ18164.1 MAG: hypothetical protein HRU76_11425 [Phycisphaeraceae bacterium]